MKSLRILRVLRAGYYGLFRDFYRRNPFLKTLPYKEHKKRLIDFAPIHLNSFSECMRKIGHDCDEVITDLESLQKSWAKEKDKPFGDFSWKDDILMEQIFAFKPEILYLQHINHFPRWLLRRLKVLVPSLKKIIIFTGFPSDPRNLSDVDMVLCAIPNIQKSFDEAGINTRLLYYYFDQNILENLTSDELSIPLYSDEIEVSFLGYSGFGGQGEEHFSRYKLLDSILKNQNAKMWLTESSTKATKVPEGSLPLKEKHPESCFSPCFGLDMYRILASSKISINRHTDAANGNVGNMRMFEATGMGSCLLTDSGNNLSDIFEDGREVISYDSREDCLEKLNFLKENHKVAKEIGEAGKQRVLKDHSLQKRCELINEIVQEIV